jgi:hypothetical protein
MTVKYSKGQENIPNDSKIFQMTVKYSKWQENIPNDRKIFRMTKTYTSIFYFPSKFFPNWDFWFENKPSGNPGGSPLPFLLNLDINFLQSELCEWNGLCFMGYLHNPTDISENCGVWHLKVSYYKNGIDPICEKWCRMASKSIVGRTKIGLILSVKIVLYDTICRIV